MIRILAVLTVFFLALPALAQDARETSIRFHKQDRPGVEADYPFRESLTEEVLLRRLKDAGLKKDNHDNGFTVYKEVEWPDVVAGKVDVYVKVDGRRNKSTIQVMITRGYDNFITPATDGPAFTNLKNFLNGLGPVVAGAQHDAEVSEQQDAVKDAEHDLHRSEREAKKAARRERHKEKESDKKDKEKDKKARELEEEQKKLEELKGK